MGIISYIYMYLYHNILSYILLVFSTIGGDSLGDISDFSTIVAALERTSKGFSDSTISPRPGIDVIPYETVLLNGAKTAKVVLQMLSARISYGLVSLTLFEGFFLLQSINYSTNSS